VGATTTHPVNHYGTATALTNLPLIANDYKSQFYPDGGNGSTPIPDADKLRYNDMSLVVGGKFEIAADWGNGSHAEHRVGINCDVFSGNIPGNRWQTLTQIFANHGSPNYNDETATASHWHLRFQ